MTEQYETDLLVIGGGINGAAIARDAAGRALSVCLVEQSDLGAFTSSASTKLIHGGLRYLEYGEFRLVAEALAERECLLGIAPHLVRPLRFVLPHSAGLRPRWQIRLGLFVYDHLGRRRALPASTQIRLATDPSGAALKPAFQHAFTYSDCAVDDSRLVVVNALDAAQNGARIWTRTRLVRAAPRENGGWKVECLHVLTGQKILIGARALINATGPWVNAVRDLLGLPAPEPIRLVQGSHIVIPRLFEGEQAYLLQNPDGRIVFAIPYEDQFTLVGTTDVPFQGDPRNVRISPQESDYLLESIGRYFNRRVQAQDIVWSYSGVRALQDDQASRAAAVTRDYSLRLEYRTRNAPILSVIGGKITTHRKLAEAALTRLEPILGCRTETWTGTVPLLGGSIPRRNLQQYVKQIRRRWSSLPPDMLERMARAYGTQLAFILGSARSLNDLGEHFGAGLTAAEVDYLRRYEWALTAEDVLWRRTKLGLRMPADGVSRLENHLRTEAAAARWSA